jgi:uncharacterized membrane protein
MKIAVGRREPIRLLYLAMLIVIVPIDFLFLGIFAKGFSASKVGDMLGEIGSVPAILFYLLCVAGVLIFVSRQGNAITPSTLLYGALSLAIASRHFGCGTIRMYGLGDFHPAG